VASGTEAAASISVAPNPVQAGDPDGVSVTGTGFAPGESVNVGYTPSLTGGGSTNVDVTTTAQNNGTILVGYLPVPADAVPDTYAVSAVGFTSGSFATATLQITAAGVATPTDTPVPAPTPTLTPVLQAVPTPTATAVAIPVISFTVQAVKIGYGSSKLASMLERVSVAHVKVGQKVKLIVYATVSGIVVPEKVSVGFRVTQGAETLFHASVPDTLTSSDSGAQLGWWQFYRPPTRGEQRLTGTLFVGVRHRHKQIYFAVSP
jgi:hypothetical protein